MDEDDATKINDVSYTSLGNIPFKFTVGFYQSCQGRIIIGDRFHKNVVELDGIDWVEDLPSLNVTRFNGVSFYHSTSKSLIIAGGLNEGYWNVSDIEVLKIDINGNGGEWQIVTGRLPGQLNEFSITEFEDDFILTGGKIMSYENLADGAYEHTNKVWKGILKEDKISFEELPPMKYNRKWHFSFQCQGKIFVFGGETFENSRGQNERLENSQIEIFDGKKWIEGPMLPCYLTRREMSYSGIFGRDNAVLNRNGKIIILSEELGIGIFDPETLSIDFFQSQYKMREVRTEFAAVLI